MRSVLSAYVFSCHTNCGRTRFFCTHAHKLAHFGSRILNWLDKRYYGWTIDHLELLVEGFFSTFIQAWNFVIFANYISLLFFAAYVICKKEYSFSRVVFLFFQSKIANSFYLKINDSSGVRTTWFWSGTSRVRVPIVPNTLRFRILTPLSSTPLIHKIFRYQEFSETQKGSPTKVSVLLDIK